MFSNVLLVLSSAFVKGRETAIHIRTYIHYHTVNKSTKQVNTAATANFLITRQFQGLNAEPNRIAYGGAPFWEEKGSNDGTSSGSLGCSKRFQWILVPRATNAFLALRVCSWWSAMEPKMQTVNCKGSSINDVRSEGRGWLRCGQMQTKGKGVWLHADGCNSVGQCLHCLPCWCFLSPYSDGCTAVAVQSGSLRLL